MNQHDALDQMRKSRAVRGIRCENTVVVPPDAFDGLVDFTDCQFADFRADCAQIFSPVKFENCTFDSVSFHGAYFLGGFVMRNCVVNGRLGFECGGHNDNGEFALVDSRFDKLVDFEDCWFTGPFRIDKVELRDGSNLLGNEGTPVAVTFDVPPTVKSVTGRLDCNTYK